MFNQSIIINMDSYTKYVQIRTEALEAEVQRLTEENKELKLFILKNNLKSNKTFPKLFHK